MPLADPLSHKVPKPRERVAGILQRSTGLIVEDWLTKVKKSKELSHVALGDQEHTGYLPKLIDDLVHRLRTSYSPGVESDSIRSVVATAHVKTRKSRAYTPAMLVHDSRILQVTLCGTLRKNLSALDFSLLLPDIVTIADEVDSQLTQAMESTARPLGLQRPSSLGQHGEHNVKASNPDARMPYERPILRKPTADQATLLLVRHAYIGNRGAKELLELVFPERTDSGSQPNRPECSQERSNEQVHQGGYHDMRR